VAWLSLISGTNRDDIYKIDPFLAVTSRIDEDLSFSFDWHGSAKWLCYLEAINIQDYLNIDQKAWKKRVAQRKGRLVIVYYYL
jgi:hypothetical protein